MQEVKYTLVLTGDAQINFWSVNGPTLTVKKKGTYSLVEKGKTKWSLKDELWLYIESDGLGVAKILLEEQAEKNPEHIKLTRNL